MNNIKWLLFYWGDTLMYDNPEYKGEMYLWTEITLMDGVLSTIPQISEKYKCAVVSNADDSDANTMKAAFERMNIDNNFTYFITSKEIGYKKPDSRFFAGIAERLHTPCHELCMIGNDYEKDIVSAKELGMKTVLVTKVKGDYPLADYVIKSFDMLINIFIANNITIRIATLADAPDGTKKRVTYGKELICLRYRRDI